jgi:hypothetical protein
MEEILTGDTVVDVETWPRLPNRTRNIRDRLRRYEAHIRTDGTHAIGVLDENFKVARTKEQSQGA